MPADKSISAAHSAESLPPRLARWGIWAVAAALIGTAVFFRVWKLDHIPGLNGDEAWYGIKAHEVLGGTWSGWLTPTNNLINPLYFVPVLALHALFEPSITLLRTAAVLSGLAALAANFFLCRRCLGARLAWITTVALAVLPISISNSRFGWDPSQILLIDVFVMYFVVAALQGNQPRRTMLWAAIAVGISLVVHPSNIFLAPLLAVAALKLWGRQVIDFLDPRKRWTRWLPCYLGALAVAALICWKGEQWVSRAVSQVARPGDAAAFSLHLTRVFSGVTTYRFLAGSGYNENDPVQRHGSHEVDESIELELTTLDGVAIWLATATLIALIVLFRSGETRWEGVFLLGYLLGLFAFFLVGGTAITDPGYERYSLWLVAPGVLLFGRAWEAVMYAKRSSLLPWGGAIGGIALGILLLLSFYTNYFAFIERTGGEAHLAFRTGDADLKQVALERILAAAPDGQKVYVASSEIWISRPLAYLSLPHDRVHVELLAKPDLADQVNTVASQKNVWLVEFTLSAEHREVRNALQAARWKWQELLVTDASGRAVLTLLEVQSREN